MGVGEVFAFVSGGAVFPADAGLDVALVVLFTGAPFGLVVILPLSSFAGVLFN